MAKDVLYIGKPYIENLTDQRKTRICVSIRQGESEYVLWYEVDDVYGPYLCTERADGFVVNLLLYAMEHGLDIECDQCMTERLYYQLVEYLIPCISKNTRKYHAISIKAALDESPINSAHAVGASLSGGVDSFYTLLRHIKRKEKSLNITHLTFFNAGASGEYGGDDARERYQERINWIKAVAEELGKELLCVDTNANEYIKQNHEATHTFRTLAIPLILQKLFSRYYFASGFPFQSFVFRDDDTACYDLLNVQCLSTDTLTFYSSGGEATRLDKLRYISEFPITYNRLNVCVADAVNCSRCEKCARTMVGLYAIGKLDLYKNVFDLDYFEKHKHKYLSDSIKYLKSHDWPESYALLKESHKLSIFDYCMGIPKLIFYEGRKAIAKNTLAKAIYHKLKHKK